MGRAFWKGVWRTIAQSRKRFISILVICALGTTMVTGLRAACVDLRQTADAFYDEQQLFDLKIQSTLGLTAADAEALSSIEDVARVWPSWEESTYVKMGDARGSVDVKACASDGMNLPKVYEGRLPSAAGEIAVTRQYLKNSGAQLGDAVALEEANDADAAVFERVPYTIVGVVADPTEMTNPDGSIAIRTSAAADYTFFVAPEAVAADAYTVLYVQVAGAAAEPCYSETYRQKVDAVSECIEALAASREEARTAEVKGEALATLEDEEADAQAQLEEAQAKLDDSAAQLAAGRAQIADSEGVLADGRAQAVQGRAELLAQAAQLERGADELAQARTRIVEGQRAAAQARGELEGARAQIEAGRTQLDAARSEIAAARTQAQEAYDEAAASARAALDSGAISPEEYDEALAQAGDRLAAATAELDAREGELAEQQSALDARAEQVARGLSQLAEQEAQLDAGMHEVERSQAELDAGADQLAAARAQLDSVDAELDAAVAQLEAARAELADGQESLDAGAAQLERSRAEAREQIDDARAQIEGIDAARWYVQDRSSNTAYASVESDAGSIEAIGFVFPVVFVVVAVLIGLTTITRMVEEERGLIGTHKSLGYSNRAISAKYFVYALAACLLGCLVGEACGFLLFPSVLFGVFEVMYSFDSYALSFDAPYGIVGMLLFVVGIAGAALIACRAELRQTPAALMRPKPPRSGSRILLERIGFVWKRLSFLNKVTARNVFRYKKRFFMTVFGIMGCMALLVCGFAIRDTVVDLSDKQYGEINRYDLLIAVDEAQRDDVARALEQTGAIAQMQGVGVDNVTLSAGDDQEALQLYVIPDGADLSPYLGLRTAEDASATLDDAGMLLTRNAAELLGVDAGSAVRLKTSALDDADMPVSAVIDGYLGNAAYVSQSVYARLIGSEAAVNAFYANLAPAAGDATAFGEEVAEWDGVRSVASTQQMIDQFSQAFQLINTIVYVIIVLAAALAFVVLFTLSATNISERMRELATIKVLGFRRREVNHYVNKEMLLLTAAGVALGLPAGWAFSSSLTYFLKMPSIYFAVHIELVSFLYAAALTMLFALAVALLSNRALARIDMIEALKSVE